MPVGISHLWKDGMKMLWLLGWKELAEQTQLPYSCSFVAYSIPNSCNNLSREKPALGSVVAIAALYYTDSILFENNVLKDWS